MNLRELFYLPDIASSHGHEIDFMIYIVHGLMLILFAGWAVYYLFVLLRFNRHMNPKANYDGVKNHLSSYVEIAVIVAEVLLLVGFSIPFWQKNVDALPTRGEVQEIRVIAEQFAWNVHYPGHDGLFGQTGVEFFDKQTNPVGIDPDDPNGKDDFVQKQLDLPLGKTVLIHLSSKDVIHAFYLPEMRVKQDIIPGMSIPVWFTPTKTNRLSRDKFEDVVADTGALWDHLIEIGYLDEEGYLTDRFKLILTSADMDKLADQYGPKQHEIFLALSKANWQIACAQLCGLGHYYMRGLVKVHNEDSFNTWYDEQIASASGGEDEEGFDDFWN